MDWGGLSVGDCWTLGVALTATFLEQQRAVHAIALAQQQVALSAPAEWAVSQLQNMFLGAGDVVAMASVKAAAQFHNMLLAEATVKAYQDIFMISGFLSLINIIPAFLRRRQSHNKEAIKSESVVPTTQETTRT